MTKTEYIASLNADPNILKVTEQNLIIDDEVNNIKEYSITVLRKTGDDTAIKESHQIYEVNGVIYRRS